MSARRVLAGSAAALLMPASLLLTVETGSAEPGPSTSASSKVLAGKSLSKRRVAGQNITLQALPQIVHQGARPAGANKAQAAFVATVRPKRVGRPMVLQVRNGTRWRTVDRAKQNGAGRAEFAALAARRGKPLTYRVSAMRFKGLRAVASPAVTTERWLNASWTDQFSGRRLSDAWSHRGKTYERASKRMCSRGRPKAVRVRGGAVRISVLRDTSRKSKCAARVNGRVKGRYAYRINGHIGTQDKATFRYGFAAARMKLHRLRGQHSSFWLLGQRGNWYGTPGHEIDVIEYFGDRHPQGGLTSFLHWYKGTKLQKTGSWIKNPNRFLKNRRDGWSKNYHVFSVEWTPERYIFRIDGQETWRTSRKVSTDHQYAILSMLASDYEIPQMKDKQLPQHMWVDWVRFWQNPAYAD